MKHLMLMLIIIIMPILTAACGAAPADEPAVAQAAADSAATTASNTNQAAPAEADPATTNEEVVLRIMAPPASEELVIIERLAAEFEAETGTNVEIIQFLSTDVSVYLEEIRQGLNVGSSDIDLYQIDVIWPGMLAEHALSLNDHLPRSEIDIHNPTILSHYTVGDKLVALPLNVDFGLLYYRPDLLEKYGFAALPTTWDDLEAMALTIQEGERAAGNDEFWGYVWQGDNYEGLTCNALEWQFSHGGGQIIEPDGTVSVDNPQTIAAFERAAGWVGTISPPEVTSYDEQVSINVFTNGNAAFLRQWPWLWEPDFRANLSEGLYGVTTLPSGGHGQAATLGGWGWMASRYSEHPELAAKLAQVLTGPELQKENLEVLGYMPSIDAIYQDSDILANDSYLAGLAPVASSTVPRPSTVTGEQYAEVSAAYYNTVHDILTGKVPAVEAVEQLESELVDITGFEAE